MEDGWPVVAEPFLQWVVEDKFVAGRPAWEKACSGPNESVLFVDDVEPYELMKLRLLNLRIARWPTSRCWRAIRLLMKHLPISTS